MQGRSHPLPFNLFFAPVLCSCSFTGAGGSSSFPHGLHVHFNFHFHPVAAPREADGGLIMANPGNRQPHSLQHSKTPPLHYSIAPMVDAAQHLGSSAADRPSAIVRLRLLRRGL